MVPDLNIWLDIQKFFSLGISALVNPKIDVTVDNDQSKFRIDYVLTYERDTQENTLYDEPNDPTKKHKNKNGIRKRFQEFLQSKRIGLKMQNHVNHSHIPIKSF